MKKKNCRCQMFMQYDSSYMHTHIYSQRLRKKIRRKIPNVCSADDDFISLMLFLLCTIDSIPVGLKASSDFTKASGWWVVRLGFQARSWPVLTLPTSSCKWLLLWKANSTLFLHTAVAQRALRFVDTNQRLLTESHIGGASAEAMLCM